MAADLLEERGREPFSVRELARRLDMSVGTIHHHFGSRDGLLNAVVDRFYANLEASARELLAELATGASHADLLDGAARLGFRHARQNREFVRWLTIDTINAGHLAPHRDDETQRPFLEAAAMALAKRLTLSPSEVKLRLRTMIMIVARYALTDVAELENVIGGATPLDDVEDHLAWLARMMFSGH